jgi:hypothetical protein
MHAIITDAPERAILDGLSSLVHLQRLTVWPSLNGHPYQIGGLSEQTLPCLAHLTYLYVNSLSNANYAQLGALSGLQELSLSAPIGAKIGAGSVPTPVFPASLTMVMFWSHRVEPGILSLVTTTLKVLDLQGPDEGPAEGPASLFSCIGQLQRLQDLYLAPDVWPPAGAAYSALTASSSLKRLAITHRTLPSGVWQYAFPATRNMMHLTHLYFDNQTEWDGLDAPSTWGALDLSRVISCCPKLRHIQGMCLQHGHYVSELHKLKSLVALDVRYAACHVSVAEETIKGLAAVTQLGKLFVTLMVVAEEEEEVLPVASLLLLTSLTALDTLELKCTFGYPWQDGLKEPLCVELEQVGCYWCRDDRSDAQR